MRAQRPQAYAHSCKFMFMCCCCSLTPVNERWMVHKLAFYDVYSIWFSHRLLANPSWYIHINSVRKFSALFNNSVGNCCLHSFLLYFFNLLSLQLQRQHPLPWSESELTIPGTKVPGNIRSWERRFPLGAFAPRSENTWERKVPDTRKNNELSTTIL